MTEIVCISAAGKAKAAKNSVARMLKDELEKDQKRVLIAHYADPLKSICRNWFGWDGRMDDEGRSFLQYVGTDIVRARRPDFWVDFTLGLLSMLGNEWDYVIIPDCRHPNEFDLERYGFQPRHIRIEDKGLNMRGRGRQTSPDKPEFTIVDGTAPERLRSDVAVVAHTLAAA
jgi:hypothetical protein